MGIKGVNPVCYRYSFYAQRKKHKSYPTFCAAGNQQDLITAKKISIKSLQREIDLIQNPNLQKLCKQVLNDTPLEFFKAPKGSASVWHPKDEHKDGISITLHLKKVCNLALWEANRFPELDYDRNARDLIITASLLHDAPYRLKKDEDGDVKVNWHHAKDNAKYIRTLMNKYEIKSHDSDLILAAITHHMGRWTPKKDQDNFYLERYKNHPVVKCVQDADYFATRPNIIVDVSQNPKDNERINLECK